ncbi:hypothetical protein NDN08_001366 [Rhodosorus marinus]|uniref:Uncharacterized protein n=1 Tax=Rhodosorus marinus TaxID=101924 RepID=A0AAV8UUU0_9RHOD|nr:hypothetical protein NDN08_001366 [Rhodosorus marinus]
MAQMRVEQELNLPVETTWKILADFSNDRHIHPHVRSVERIGELERGVGAARKCHLRDGGCITEKVTAWDEAAREYTLEVFKSPEPKKRFFATLRVEECEANRSKAAVVVDYDPKYGCCGELLGRFILLPKLGHLGREYLDVTQSSSKKREDVPPSFQVPKTSKVPETIQQSVNTSS